MARSSRWKDSGAQAQGPAPVPGQASPDPVPPTPPINDTGAHPAPAAGGPLGAASQPAPVAQQRNPFAPPPPPTGAGAPDAPVAPVTAPVHAVAPAQASTVAAAGVEASAAPGARVQGEVAELRSTLAELQATVATLVERTAPAAPVSPVNGDSANTDQASRIIVMANRAAESTLEEARAEAAGIVAGAKTQSFEIIRMARELANQELAAERERVARSTAEWSARRAEIGEHLQELATSLAGYQDGLDVTAAAITTAIAGLESAAPELPVIDALPAPDPAGFVGSELPGAAAQEAVLAPDADETAAAQGDDEVVDLTDAAAEDLSGSPRTKLFGADPVAESDPETPPIEADASTGVDAPPADVAPDGPAKTLRPGLFGR